MNDISVSMTSRSDSEKNQPAEDISITELVSLLWKRKWLVVLVSGMFSVGSIAISLTLPNIYKAEVTLAPASLEQQNSVGALASQLGGLASFAGINLGGANMDNTTVALEVLGSRQFLGDFIERHQIMPELMAARDWDLSSNTLEYDSSVYSISQNKWVREAKPPFGVQPSIQEAYKQFLKVLTFEQSKDTGMVEIGIEHYSPHIAKSWLDNLVFDLNQTMKERDVTEAEQSISYLNDQIENTNLAGLRSVFFELIEEQTKTLMLASVRDEYAFTVIDPAVASEFKHKPSRALIVILGTLLGLVLSLMAILLLALNRK